MNNENMEYQLKPASVWILNKFLATESNLENYVRTYDLAHCVDELYHFLWDYYADWYVEYLKTDSSQLIFAKELFRQFVITLSPYSPFETEVLWKEYFGEQELLAWQIHNPNLLSGYQKANDTKSSEEFELITKIVTEIRSLRGLFAIDPATRLTIYSNNHILKIYKEFLALSGKCELIEEERPDLYGINVGGIKLSINISALISNIPQEIERTNKIIADLNKQILQLENQLNNPKFIDNAEADIIEDKKQNLVLRQSELLEQTHKLKFLQTL